MNKQEKQVIEALYDAIKDGKTVLGFDEKRGVGVISLVEYRQEGDTQLLHAAEITSPLLLSAPISE